MEPTQSWIVNDTDKILRTKSTDVTFPLKKEEQELVDRMVLYVDACHEKKSKIYNIRAGIALAAPQVGLMKKIIYIHFNDAKQEHRYLIANPKIVAESMTYAYVSAGEGCLSVEKDVIGIVKRRNKVYVQAYDILNKQNAMIEAEGLLAICLQHEIDHLSGILYYDRIDKLHPLVASQEWIKY